MNRTRRIAGLVIVSALLSCRGGDRAQGSSAGSQPTASAAAAASMEKPTVVTAKQLYSDYKANEVAADEKYKGKRLIVTGPIASIEKDAFDDMVVYLSCGDGFDINHASATLRTSEKSKAMSLKKGSPLGVLCKGDGMIMGNPVLSDCVLPDPSAAASAPPPSKKGR